MPRLVVGDPARAYVITAAFGTVLSALVFTAMLVMMLVEVLDAHRRRR